MLSPPNFVRNFLLAFGDYRTFTIRYTGVEIRQDPQSYVIEVGQEAYIGAMEPVRTKPLGNASTPLRDPRMLKSLCWTARMGSK